MSPRPAAAGFVVRGSLRVPIKALFGRSIPHVNADQIIIPTFGVGIIIW